MKVFSILVPGRPALSCLLAKRQDKAGLPGTKMLKTFMDYMRDNKQTVVRNWDKE